MQGAARNYLFKTECRSSQLRWWPGSGLLRGSDLVNQLGCLGCTCGVNSPSSVCVRGSSVGESLIPASVFEPHPSTSVRHANSKPLFLPRVHTDYHRGSYFVSTVPLWNSIVPDRILTSTSRRSFKFHLRNYLFSIASLHHSIISYVVTHKMHREKKQTKKNVIMPWC